MSSRVRTLTRIPLPHVTPTGDTVTRDGADIYINGQPYTRVDALDYSAAIARAVSDAAQHQIDNHTNQTEGA